MNFMNVFDVPFECIISRKFKVFNPLRHPNFIKLEAYCPTIQRKLYTLKTLFFNQYDGKCSAHIFDSFRTSKSGTPLRCHFVNKTVNCRKPAHKVSELYKLIWKFCNWYKLWRGGEVQFGIFDWKQLRGSFWRQLEYQKIIWSKVFQLTYFFETNMFKYLKSS